MTTPPDKVKEKGFDPDLRRAFNMMVDHVRSLKIRTNDSVEVDHQSGGQFIRAKGTGKNNGSPQNVAPRWG